MNDKSFVDSNVLIYAHDADAGVKREAAAALLRELWAQRSGILSTQVLHEFYVNVTRKIAAPVARSSARAVVDAYAPWCVNTTVAEISAAFRIEDEARISFLGCADCGCRAQGRSGPDSLRRPECGPDHRRHSHREPVFRCERTSLSARNRFLRVMDRAGKSPFSRWPGGRASDLGNSGLAPAFAKRLVTRRFQVRHTACVGLCFSFCLLRSRHSSMTRSSSPGRSSLSRSN